MNYDDISIGIQANANAANTALDSLVSRLTAVSVAIHNVNTGGFQGLANGVSMLGNAMSSMKSSGVTSADFSRLATNLNKLASVNTAGIAGLAGSISQVGASIANIPGATEAAASIGSLGNALAVFSYKKVDTAIANMPRIAQAFTEMMGSLSNAPAVSENLINTANALANVASQANGVKSLANTFNDINRPTTQSSNILKTFISNLFNTNNGAKSLKGGIDSLAASFGKFYASCFLIIRALKQLGSAIKSAMDYVETFNYFNVTMNKIGSQFSGDFKKYGYNSAKAYADSFRTTMDSLTTKMTGFKVGENGTLDFSNSKNLGLDAQAIQNYEAQVSAVTNSVGLMGETSRKAATALTMLAADYSSLRNLDLSEVMTNFNSGLIGQSRALYKYGIDITNATLQTYAYKYGITTAVSEMTQADKMQLRLAAILDQSRIAWGDQANTINSVANQYRIMKAQVSNLARTIGSLFIPLLQAVLPYINAFLIALQHLAMWFGKLIGIDFAKNMDGISQAYGGGTDALDGLSDAGDDATDSLNGTNAAAKKLQKTILGFDEINALSDNSDTSSGTGKGKGAGGIDLSGPIGDLLDEYNKAWDDAFKKMQNRAQELAQKLMNYFRSGDYKGLGTAISGWIRRGLKSINWNKIYSVMGKFGTGLAEFLNGLIRPDTFKEIGKTIANSLNSVLKLSYSFLKTFDATNFGKSIAAGINSFFANFNFGLLATDINTWVNKLENFIAASIGNIKWSMVFRKAGEFFSTLEPDTIAVILGIFVLPKIISSAFKTILSDPIIQEAIISKITSWFVGVPNVIKGLVTTAIANPLAAALVVVSAFILVIHSVEEGMKNRSEIEKYGETISSLQDKYNDANEAAKNFKQTIKTDISDAGVGETERAKDLAEQYENISSKITISKDETQKLKDISSELVSLVPQLEPYLNTDTEILQIQSGTLDDIIQKTEEYYQKQAAKDLIVEAYKDQYNAMKDVENAQNILTQAQTSYNQASSYGLEHEKQLKSTYEEAQSALNTAAETYDDTRQSVDYLNGVLNDDQEAMKKASDETNYYSKANGDAALVIENNNGKIKESIKTIGPELAQSLHSGTKHMYNSMNQNTYIEAPKAGGNIADGIGKGFEDKKANAFTIIGDWCWSVIENIKSIFKTHSPSKVTEEIGGNIAQGLTEGISHGSIIDVGIWAQSLINKFSLIFSIKTFSSDGSSAADAINSGFNTNIVNFYSAISNISGRVYIELQPFINNCKTAGTNAINGIRDNFSNGISSFISVVSSIPGKISSALGNLFSVGKNAVQSFINGFKSLTIPLPHIDISSEMKTVLGKSIEVPKIDVKWYASGGYPKVGDIFGANENGIEMMGTMGSKPVVANNQEIIAGISAGVKQAMAEVMMAFTSNNSSSSAPVIENVIKMGDETVYRSAKRGEASYNNRYHVVTEV